MQREYIPQQYKSWRPENRRRAETGISYFYVVHSPERQASKIGYSTLPTTRVVELRREFPQFNQMHLSWVASCEASRTGDVEREFHRMFKPEPHSLGHEWYALDAQSAATLVARSAWQCGIKIQPVYELGSHKLDRLMADMVALASQPSVRHFEVVTVKRGDKLRKNVRETLVSNSNFDY